MHKKTVTLRTVVVDWKIQIAHCKQLALTVIKVASSVNPCYEDCLDELHCICLCSKVHRFDRILGWAYKN